MVFLVCFCFFKGVDFLLFFMCVEWTHMQMVYLFSLIFQNILESFKALDSNDLKLVAYHLCEITKVVYEMKKVLSKMHGKHSSLKEFLSWHYLATILIMESIFCWCLTNFSILGLGFFVSIMWEEASCGDSVYDLRVEGLTPSLS